MSQPPPSATTRIHYLEAAGEPRLALHLDAVESPRAVVIMVPGMGDHADRHLNTRRALTEKSVACAAVDLRGHGLSGGPARYVRDFEDFCVDVARALAFVQQDQPGVPIFLLGHSMGGLVAARFAANRQSELAGLVLSSALLELAVRIPALKIAVGRQLSFWWPSFRVPTELAYGQLSRDPVIIEDVESDRHTRKWICARLGAEMLNALHEAPALARRITVPLFIFHGGADSITSPAGSEDFHRQTASKDKTLKLYPGCRHEMHNELSPDREQYFADLANWVIARAALPPPAA